MSLKARGLKALQAKVKKMPPEVRSAIKQALAESADELVAMQKRLAPVRDGDLRDSITQTWGDGALPKYAAFQKRSKKKASPVSGDKDLQVRVSAGNSAVRYAHLVEYGTAPHINAGKFPGTQHPGTEAQPFFFPAYRALRKRIKSRISRATSKSIKRIAAGG